MGVLMVDFGGEGRVGRKHPEAGEEKDMVGSATGRDGKSYMLRILLKRKSGVVWIASGSGEMGGFDEW